MARRAIEVSSWQRGGAESVLSSSWLAKKKSDKRRWRLRLLEALGIDVGKLQITDQVDAALAVALTGIYSLNNRFVTVGHSSEGVIVLPVEKLLDNYRREQRAPPPTGVIPGARRFANKRFDTCRVNELVWE